MRGRTGGARFTGASASLKVVSGRSTRGTADTKTAAPNRKRTNIQRSRFTLLHPKHQAKYSRTHPLSMMFLTVSQQSEKFLLAQSRKFLLTA